MELNQLIKKHLAKKEAMQLATSKDGKPRLCTVHFAFDDDLNLYWVSSSSAQHSEDLRENKATAAAVLIDANKRQCIHFEGESFELEGKETVKADAVYAKKFGIDRNRLESALKVKRDNPAYYILKPSLITLIDVETFPDNPTKKILL